MTDPRFTKLAELLVRYSTQVKPGDAVLLDMFDVPDEFSVELMRAERWFDAHEALEDEWREAPAPERDFLQGLVHVTVAWHHASRGNRPGAAELYNVSKDVGETSNMAAENPEVVRELSALLRQAREGRQARLD